LKIPRVFAGLLVHLNGLKIKIESINRLSRQKVGWIVENLNQYNIILKLMYFIWNR